jgi:signal transduction histidine kinase
MTERLMRLSVTAPMQATESASVIPASRRRILPAVATHGDAERLRRLQLVTDAALSHLDLDELLAELLTRIRDVLDADTAAVLLRDELRNELVARSAVGLEEEVEQGVRIPVGSGFAGRIAAERRPIVLDEVERADVLNPLLREQGVKSIAGVPLVFANEVLGVLHVGTLTPRQFAKEDVELLEIVADRVALAIEHTRLFEAERRGRARLERVQTVMEATLANLGFDELVGELLVRIRDVLDVDTAAVLMLDESTNELVARAAVGLEEEVERAVRIPVGAGFAGRIAAEKRAIVLDDVDHADVLNPILREKGVKSLLGVPMIASDSVIGVLHVGTLSPRFFTFDDQELLELVASRAAIAIEKARIHDELVRLHQMKLNFVAIASHELRTPATSVYGIAATLRHQGDELAPDARKELVEALWEQAERFRSLIEQLLDLSRLDAKAILIKPQALVLGALLSEIAAEAAPETEVRIDVPEELEVTADRAALERIFGNLVRNAVSYGEPPVVVSVQSRDTYFRVSVEDHGNGVPPEVVPRLFERFERGSVGQGSGLGLSIAQAYARAHGGDLIYDPSAGGARFDLILPRS